MIENNAIFEYYNAIKTGKEVVSKKVHQFYKYITLELKNKKSKYYFSEKHAKHAIDFIEKYCKHSKGKWAKKPIVLELWQRAFLSCLFGILRKSDNLRRFRRAILFVARKNGKSLLSAGIGNYCFMADGEGGAECYSVATQREQAKIIWNESRSMIKKSPVLCKRAKCLIGEIKFGDNVYKPLASDSNNLDGLNTHFAGLDEIHAWKDQNLYDVILNSISAREQPIILSISTMGTVRENVFDDLYDECERIINGYFDKTGYKDDSVLPIIYELDSRSEWTDPTKWRKANPNLGVSKSIEYLETEVNKAKANNKKLKNTLCKDFNIRETSTEAWLSFEEILNERTFKIEEIKPDYAILGADLSRTTDLTACGLLFGKTGYDELFWYPMFWLPEDLLEKHVNEDKVPYDIWLKNGYLRTCNGNKIDTDDVIDWLIEVLDTNPDLIISNGGYDSWSATEFVKKLDLNFGKVFEPVIQGKKTLSLPMQELGAEIKAKRINYGNNPIMRWCMSNTRSDTDRNGNIQPAKTLNARQRIDGTAALLNAYTVYLWHKEEYLYKINL